MFALVRVCVLLFCKCCLFAVVFVASAGIMRLRYIEASPFLDLDPRVLSKKKTKTT